MTPDQATPGLRSAADTLADGLDRHRRSIGGGRNVESAAALTRLSGAVQVISRAASGVVISPLYVGVLAQGIETTIAHLV
jgi:hypothetical protein